MQALKRPSLIVATLGLLLAFQNCSPVEMSAMNPADNGVAFRNDEQTPLPSDTDSSDTVDIIKVVENENEVILTPIKSDDGKRDDDTGKPADIAKPDETGKPEDTGRPDDAGKPEETGKPGSVADVPKAKDKNDDDDDEAEDELEPKVKQEIVKDNKSSSGNQIHGVDSGSSLLVCNKQDVKIHQIHGGAQVVLVNVGSVTLQSAKADVILVNSTLSGERASVKGVREASANEQDFYLAECAKAGEASGSLGAAFKATGSSKKLNAATIPALASSYEFGNLNGIVLGTLYADSFLSGNILSSEVRVKAHSFNVRNIESGSKVTLY